MSIKIGNIEFFAGPNELGAPDQLESVLINFIDGAVRRLDVAVQELQSKGVAEAIVRARRRKVCVRIVLEQDYLRESRMVKEPFEPGGEDEENRFLHDAFLRANIDVKVDYNRGIFHQKFMIRDRGSVLTGSANFTPTGLHKNLNHLLIIDDAETASIYTKEFNEIQMGRFGVHKKGTSIKPRHFLVGNLAVKILFAPYHNPEMEIMKQMMKANQRIDFAIFTFAQSSGIDDAMFKLLELNMKVQGVFDASQGGQTWSAIPELVNKGAELYKVRRTAILGKLHHKLMVLDDRLVISGSFNYTSNANRINDENIIIIGDLDAVNEEQVRAQREFGRFVREEVERIVLEHGRMI